jgi:flagellar hook-length control protein FliK
VGQPNTAVQATAERSVREETNLPDKGLEAPKADAPKRSAVNVETDNSQDRVALQMERETATKASWTDQEAASLSKPNRHADHPAHGRTVSGLSSKEAAQLAADEIKKSTTSLRDNGEMNRPSSFVEAEVSSVRTAATTRLNPSKETVALYATAAESEKDRSKVMAAKGNHDDQTAETAQMKSFTLGSSQSAETGSDSGAGPTEAKARALVDQIVEARQQMSSESGRIKITLTPPNLGTVDLDVVVRQNRVEVIMIADHADVQQLLQARGEEIKSALQRQDMKIESFQVFLQSSPDGGQQQQSGSWTAMQDHSRRQYASYDTQEDEGALPLPTSEAASTTSTRGWSVFLHRR